MAGQNQVTEKQSGNKTQNKVGPAVVAELPGDALALAERPAGITAAGGGSVEAQAAWLNDGRLHSAQRRALTARIGRVQGNQHLQRVVALQQKNTRAKRDTSVSTSTVQRAVPQIAEPPAPDVSSMDPDDRQGLSSRVRTYLGGRTQANGQAVVDAIVDWLDPATVQYRNQSDIADNSPRFLDTPSSAANRAATQDRGSPLGSQVGGFAFVSQTTPTVLYRVEIYRRAFLAGATPEQQLSHLIGTIVHEFVHILQYRRQHSGQAGRGEQFTSAHLEFQAWLWQGEHASDMGVQPGTPPYNQIVSHLGQFYDQLPPRDKQRYRARYARVIFEALYYQFNMLVEAGALPSESRVARFQEIFGWMPAADRRRNNARYRQLLARIRALRQQSSQ